MENSRVYYNSVHENTGASEGGSKSNVLGSVYDSDSISRLPSIAEARETFLFFIRNHCPVSSLNGKQSSNYNYNISTMEGGRCIDVYNKILFNNLSNGRYYLSLDIQDILYAGNDYIRLYKDRLYAEEEAKKKKLCPENRYSEISGFDEIDSFDYGNSNIVSEAIDKSALSRLYNALRSRPLWYLKSLEDLLKELVVNEINLKRLIIPDLSHDDTDSSVTNLDLKDIQLLLECGIGYNSFQQIRDLGVEFQEKFVVVGGIVIQASACQHKITTATVECRYCDHRFSITVHATRDKLQIPSQCFYAASVKNRRRMNDTWEADDQNQLLGCMNAKDPYIIITTESRFTDVQTLKLQELPESIPVGDVPRSVLINCSGYNCGNLLPGERVRIHGALSNFNLLQNPSDIEAQGVPYIHTFSYEKRAQDHSEQMVFSESEKVEFASLGGSPDIHKRIFRSIAPALYGLEDVKKAVACVLFGGVQKLHSDGTLHRGDINMLMLGDPSVAKSQVLKFANRAAAISVYTSGKGSSGAGLTASVIRDKSGVFALEGGAMVLADGGVVCIDEFDKMREEDIVCMHEAMEQQTISINKAGISTILNSRCAVLAAANPTFGSYDDTQDTSEQHEMKSTILSRFDVIFMLRDKENVDRDSRLCRHILDLQEGKGNSHDEDIPLETLHRYISYARQSCTPRLSVEAIDKLRTFYVSTREDYRKDKRSKTKKIPITIRQLESLFRLTESFARMQLRSQACEIHVDMAIELFNASTVETSKHTMIFEALPPSEQRMIQQAEETLLNRLQSNQRIGRSMLIRDLKAKGFEIKVLSRAIGILVKKGILEERADRSLRRR